MISKKPFFSWVLESHRALQLLILVMILCTVFFRIYPVELQKRIINAAIAYGKIDLLLLYCGLYIGAVVLAGTLKYVINLLQGYIGQKILLEMRAQLYAHILSLPLPFFRKTPPGTVIASITSELSVVGEFMGEALATPIINILTLVAFAGYLAWLNPLLAAVSFAVYPVEIVIIPILQKRFNRANQERIDVLRSMSNAIGEAVSGMHEVHGNAGYPVENRKLARFAGSLFHIRNRMNACKYFIKFTNNFFQSLGPFILFLLGGYLTIRGQLDLGSLVAFLSAYEKLYDPWKELMDYYQSYQDCKVRYRHVMDCFDTEPDFELTPAENREPFRLEGDIAVNDLSFMVDNGIRILDGISLGLKPGEQVALVGLSGSGKSTLAMVIAQLYTYGNGHVLMDGIELKTLTKFDVSRNVGFVAQQPFIFDGTIRENLLYACQSLAHAAGDRAKPLPDREELLTVLRWVGISEDILKIGLGTVLIRERDETFAEELVRARQAYRQFESGFPETIEPLDVHRFQYLDSIGENITFGDANLPEFEDGNLAQNALFRDFLVREDLMPPLLHIGEELIFRTVSLLQELQQDSFFFENSPISFSEFEHYRELADRLNKRNRTGLSRRDTEAVLRIALRFTPALHKMAALPPSIEGKIVQGRQAFMRTIAEKAPGAFTFHRQTEYAYNQTILQNVIFGHLRTDHPQAAEQVNRQVVDLLRQEGLLDRVLEAGLEFRVGSRGDRLSGGQKQKVAIARALLKKPRILILDEATASLDNASQAMIQQLLSTELRGKCTLLAVAHRLETIRGYDQIAVMKAGRIVEIGQYEELMTEKGLFYDLAHGN
ncbi:MAG: ABC transporter ATP-binding protein/permease [Desulfobacteraceae bacterium]|nr:ABC transporter ATP-binding protein/permease [Desulfobacteraceae bacterium]